MSLTFGSTLNILDVMEKKSTLRKVSHTIHTRHDGSRFSTNNDDGSSTELAKESIDEDGNWAILDEAGALGLSKEDFGSKAEESKDVAVPLNNNSILVDMIKDHPQLAQYLILLKVGVPPITIRSKVFTDGVAAALPEGVAQSFCEAIGASQDAQATPVSQLVGTAMEGDHSELHGHLGDLSWEAPHMASFSDVSARAGYNTEKGHEYLDTPTVLRAKVKLLAAMLLKADKPVFYAGAGLSTASGIGDYATQTGEYGVLAKSGHKGANVSPFCVSPNFGHHCIAALAKRGLVHRFIQQNHDGLPQKAGMNQGLINEIHGGWFDPSNPVVAMSGGLRSDLFGDLLEVEQETDLVIAVGSSLCGMNSDRLVSTSASKARAYREQQQQQNITGKTSSYSIFKKRGKGKEQFGSVIISLQKTVHDHNSSLRIFALIDDVFKLLAEELKLDMNKQQAKEVVEVEVKSGEAEEMGDGVYLVPYSNDGLLLQNPKQLMRLDLSEGAELIITSGPDQGANAVMLGRNKDGHYRVSVERKFKKGSQRTFSETRLLGSWWPHNAMSGEVNYIPVVNRSPQFANSL